MLVITPYFNPSSYSSLKRNHQIFAQRILSQGANLLTVELTFKDCEPQLNNGCVGKVAHLKSNSVMWQKEQIINWALKNYPPNDGKFAWVDCDILFKDGDWIKRAEDKLEEADIIQLFKKVYNLKPGQLHYGGDRTLFFQSVLWQYKIHKNWLNRRKEKELPFAHPGFAWAARVDALPQGLYPFSITGSGDTLMVDAILNSWDIHSYARSFTYKMWESITKWQSSLLPNMRVDYIPEDIYHLYHGSLKNRNYTHRHNMLVEHSFDPEEDVTQINGVLEWNSPKYDLHGAVENYFLDRKEDAGENES